MIDRPCKFAINPSGDCWECTCWRNTYCADQIFDINPDDTVNVVTCRLGYEQTEREGEWMTYTKKELDQFLHGISLSLLSKKSAQHWRYDEETAKEIEWLEALERKVRADKADRKTEPRKEQNFCGKCRYLYRDFKYGLSCYRLMDNEPCKYEERKTEPTCDDCIWNVCNYNKVPWDEGDEPQTCDDCIWSVCNYNKAFEDEPQTERSE